MYSQIEREEEYLEKEYAEGRISLKEYNEQMRDLHREYREAAREAAQEAYDREMDSW